MEPPNRFLKSYLEHCRYEKNLSPLTLKAYELDLNHFLQCMGKEREVVDVDKELIKSYIKVLFDKPLKEASVKRKVVALKAFFAYMEAEGLLGLNPFHNVRVSIRTPKIIPMVMSLADVLSMINLINNELAQERNCAPGDIDFLICGNGKGFRLFRDLLIIKLLFATGMRVRELSNLNIDDIDIARGVIKVNGKGSKQRIIPIPNEQFSKLILSFIKLREKQDDGMKCLLKNRLNKRMDTQSIRTIIRKHVIKAGLQKRITPHVFRHTIATMLLENGTDIRFVQTFLGHSSILTTQLYTHASEAAQRKAIILNHPINFL